MRARQPEHRVQPLPPSFPCWATHVSQATRHSTRGDLLGETGIDAELLRFRPIRHSDSRGRVLPRSRALGEIDKAALGLRFTLHLPVNPLIPPGHWELFETAFGFAQAGALTPLNDSEQRIIEELAHKSDPLFPLHE